MVDTYHSFQPAQSPLYMVMHDPVLHQFISYLAEKKRQQEANPREHVTIEISRGFMTKVRESFKQHILGGEFQLHVLAHVLASHFFGKSFELHSNAIGVLPGGENRPFLIRERITAPTLFSHTDLDLGNLLVGNFQYRTGEQWLPLGLSANYVEYIPVKHPQGGANRLTSRVKAEEELWNKVADELFDVDGLIRRDKHLRQFSKYIKDVFGIKVVCENDAACLDVHRRLQALTSAECDWTPLEGELGQRALRERRKPGKLLLEFVETKDYLTCDPSQMKKTGWKAIKSVVQWQDQLIEIQVQPLSNYYLEIDHMAGPSHHSFKLTRDGMRTELADRIPLYGFYRDLLRMLFLNIDVSFEYEGASVVVKDDVTPSPT